MKQPHEDDGSVSTSAEAARPPSELSDAELLAQLLSGPAGQSRAQAILREFGGLGGLARQTSQDLERFPGLGAVSSRRVPVALELARRCAREVLEATDVLSSPQAVRDFLCSHLGFRDREVFSCLYLDSQHRLLRCEDLFFGTLDGAAVYPREVAVRALQYRAGALIFAHNHPSGVAQPSAADRRITQRLSDALSLFDIRVLDHLIVGRGTTYSFAENGIL
ncbi:MAG: DNA repair protein RadC [Halioglobus sp.]